MWPHKGVLMEHKGFSTLQKQHTENIDSYMHHSVHVPLKLIRSAWQAASERVQGFDELSMASLRFTQLLPDEPDTAEPHVLKPFEVGVRIVWSGQECTHQL